MRAATAHSRHWKSNRGTSSILVILIMVTLIVLGLLALMSTWSELKLARKNADWVKTCYIMDAKAEGILSGIDSTLTEAGKAASDYIAQKSYEKTESGILPAAVQNAVNAGWQNARTGGREKEYLDHLYPKLYFLLASMGFQPAGNTTVEMKSQFDFTNPSVYETEAALPDNAGLTLSYLVGDEGSDRNLSVSLEVKPGAIGLNQSGEDGYYTITSWKELPKKFQYEDTIDFENLEVQ